jgi:hypothetical protein
VFAIAPERRSPSARNGVRNHPGIVFGFIPESRSGSPGFPSESKRLSIVITMRSDYLGACAEFRGLPEVLNTSQYLVPRLHRNNCERQSGARLAESGSRVP